MNDTTARRLTPYGILIGVLLMAGAFGLWYSTESAVQADENEAQTDDVIAMVGEAPITRAEVLEANAEGFEQAEIGRQQQILEHERNTHELLERTLDTVISDRLLEMEAAAHGITVEELTAKELDSKVSEPTDEAVDTFYDANKARLSQPKESMAPRIREYLAQQARQQVYVEYVAGLRAKYGVESYLEPMRLAVESKGFPAKGPESAPVTIVEFSDFECPFCSRVVPTLDRVTEQYGDQVRLVFRQFPLHQIHANAQKAAEASLCAFDQDRFWEMHDTMFQEQKALTVDQLKQKAARLGLEAEPFNECLDSGKYTDQVMADVEAGRVAGVTGTPAMFINGRFLSGAQPFEEIARVIEDELDRVD